MGRNEDMWTPDNGQSTRPRLRLLTPFQHGAGCVQEARYTAADMNVLGGGGSLANRSDRCRDSLIGRTNGRRSRNQNAQQELLGK